MGTWWLDCWNEKKKLICFQTTLVNENYTKKRVSVPLPTLFLPPSPSLSFSFRKDLTISKKLIGWLCVFRLYSNFFRLKNKKLGSNFFLEPSKWKSCHCLIFEGINGIMLFVMICVSLSIMVQANHFFYS